MTRYRIPQRLLRASVGDEEVLFSVKSGSYHLVSETGRTVLAALADGSTVEQAANDISQATGADPGIVLRDSRAFVAAMLERGLIEEIG